MDRRRALLAASQTGGGGGDSPIDFPLYLNFDQCTNWILVISCERAADETSIILHDYLKEVAQQYGTGIVYTVNEDVLNSLGIDIYIEGEHVTDDGIGLINDGEYNNCTLRSDGWLIYEN